MSPPSGRVVTDDAAMHAGEGSHPRQHVVVERDRRGDLLRRFALGEALSAGPQPHRQDAGGLETGLHRQQPGDAAHQHPGTGEQHRGHRDVPGHQHRAGSPHPRRRRCDGPPRAARRRRRDGSAVAAAPGRTARRWPSPAAPPRRRREHRATARPAAAAPRTGGRDQPHRRPGRQQAEQRAHRREQHRLGEQLAHQPRPRHARARPAPPPRPIARWRAAAAGWRRWRRPRAAARPPRPTAGAAPAAPGRGTPRRSRVTRAPGFV